MAIGAEGVMRQFKRRRLAFGVHDIGHVDTLKALLRIQAIGVGADQEMDDERIQRIAGEEAVFRIRIGESLAMREVFAVLERVAALRRDACSSRARPAPARSSSRARSTTRRRAGAARSSPSIAARCPRACSRASCSATCAARSPAPRNARAGMLVRADGGTLFLDELGGSRRPCRRACCACSRSASCARSAATASAPSTCAWSPPRATTSTPRSPPAGSAPISSTGSPSCASRCRRCASAARTSRCSCASCCAGAASPTRRRAGAEPRSPARARLARQRARAAQRASIARSRSRPARSAFADLAIRIDAGAARRRRRSPCAATCRTPRPRPRCCTTSSAATSPTCSRARDGNLSAASRESGIDRKHLRALARKHGLVAGPEDTDDE